MKQEIALCDLPMNTEAVVTEVGCGGDLTNRICDMGITIGAKITPRFTSPFQDPTAYFIKNTLIALRKKDSSKIWVEVE